jgi:DNA repair protein RadC
MNNDGHRKRLKEKYLKNGLSGFLDYEILELLLTFSIPRKDCKTYAKELLKEFRSIQNVLHADKSKLFEISGIKDNSFILFKLLLDINKIAFKESSLKGKTISSIDEVVEYFRYDIAYSDKEVFKIIFLNVKNVFIAEETMFEGTLDRSHIYPREVIKAIFRHEAKSVIFCHNHPSGEVKPSKADIAMTEKFKKLLNELEINLLDHIVVGKNGYYSFYENNIL